MKKTVLFVAITCLIGFTLVGKLDFTFEDISPLQADNKIQPAPAPAGGSELPVLPEVEPEEPVLPITPVLPIEPEIGPLPELEEPEIGPLPRPDQPEPAPVEPAPIKPQKPGPKPSPKPEPKPTPIPQPQPEPGPKPDNSKEEQERKQKEEQERLKKEREDQERKRIEEEDRLKKEQEKKKEEPKGPVTSGPIITPLPVPEDAVKKNEQEERERKQKEEEQARLKKEQEDQEKKRREEVERLKREQEERERNQKDEPRPKKEKKIEQLTFDFRDKNLGDIVNMVAAKTRKNIILPQGPDAIKTTVTFDQKNIRLEDAEHYMDLFLDLSGYMINPNNGFEVINKKTDKGDIPDNMPLHLYVNVPPKDLPHSTEAIRTIYYLSNIQVPQISTGTEAISQILRNIVGPNSFIYDGKSNGIIIHGNSDKISSAMEIILALDSTGSPEVVEVFPLFHADAKIVAQLMQQQIAASKPKGAAPPGGRPVAPKNETGFYFTPNTNIIADTRTNSLVMMGTESALKRIKTFIRDYIDIPMESGESLLRVYDIQYLEAKDLAEVLKNLVKRSVTGQSEKEAPGGAHRFFEDVIIAAQVQEKVETSQTGQNKTLPSLSIGGNRLIVAAKKEDQKIIKGLIQQLDKPELQIIIEVMILDITVDGAKLIAAQTRNPVSLQLPAGISFENANIFNTLTGQAPVNPTTTPSLVTDLLALLQLTTNGPKQSIAVNPGTVSPNIGATIISFKDPCQDSIWSVMQILDNWTTTSIISHPFLVTKNHVSAENKLTFVRRGLGREVASGGVTTVKEEDFTAWIKVDVTPHASSLERLNLQISVDVQNFIADDPSVFTRTTRGVSTNATLNSGQILVLGGLVREVDLETETKWPILGDIPIFGQWFRGVKRAKTKTNLAVILHPTVVHPKMRSGQNRYTDDKINNERSLLTNEELFSSSKDPIIRWFFNDMGGKRGADTMNTYLDDAHYAETHNEGTFNPIDWEAADRSERSRVVKASAVSK